MEKNNIVTLNDNKEYFVLDFLEIENKKYACLNSVEDEKEFKVFEVENENLKEIENNQEILKLFEIKFQE